MMENSTEHDTGRPDTSAEMPAVTVGQMLSEARERLGLTVMDVASQIKFAPKQIEALEADDFQHLPETAFLRGFVRSYAKILHLDAQTLLAALPRKDAAQPGLKLDSTGEQFPDARTVQRQNNMVWLGATLLLIALVAGFAFWQFSAPPDEAKTTLTELPVSLPEDSRISLNEPIPESAVIQPVEPEDQRPVQAPTAPATARQAEQNIAATPVTQADIPLPITSLRLEFIEESWAEIKDRDGKILSSRIHPGGSELRLQGHAPFSILIGHAPSVRLYYRDKEVDLAPHTRVSTQVASLTLE